MVDLRRFGAVHSTQDLAHELAAAGAAHGTAVVATEQRSGRGSRGREWYSPAGGLWLSVLCRPPELPALEVLSLRVALAVAGALEGELPGLRLQLKWPNDLMLQDHKLGGILCEARWQGPVPGWVTVGVGINVTNQIPDHLAGRAIALSRLRPDLDPGALAEPVARHIAAAARVPGSLSAAELAGFGARDWLAGRRLVAPVPGIAEGLAPDGALRVRIEGEQIVPVRSGTVMVEQ